MHSTIAIIAIILTAVAAQTCPVYTCVIPGESCFASGSVCPQGTYCVGLLNPTCDPIKTSGTCSSAGACGDVNNPWDTYACTAGNCKLSSPPGDKCIDNTDCQGSGTCTGGICQALAVGDTCTGLADPRLAWNTYCNVSVVLASKPTGGFCEPQFGDTDCQTRDLCISNVCTAPYTLGAGATCVRAQQCTWGTTCIAGTCQTPASISPGTGCNTTVNDCPVGASCDCNLNGQFLCHGFTLPNCGSQYSAIVSCVTSGDCSMYGRQNCAYRVKGGECIRQFCDISTCAGSDPFYNQPCPFKCDASFISLGLVLLITIAALF